MTAYLVQRFSADVGDWITIKTFYESARNTLADAKLDADARSMLWPTARYRVVPNRDGVDGAPVYEVSR